MKLDLVCQPAQLQCFAVISSETLDEAHESLFFSGEKTEKPEDASPSALHFYLGETIEISFSLLWDIARCSEWYADPKTAAVLWYVLRTWHQETISMRIYWERDGSKHRDKGRQFPVLKGTVRCFFLDFFHVLHFLFVPTYRWLISTKRC